MNRPSDWLKELFSPHNLETPAKRADVGYAFQNLCYEYINSRSAELSKIIGFDPVALEATLVRFHRDAFGVHHFESYLSAELKRGVLPKGIKDSLSQKLQNLSVRINSSNPRKTRIAAAFSLWFSAMRPMYLKGTSCKGFTATQLSTLSGACNFYIAALYLSQFGALELGEGQDRNERLSRIQYDLTFRDLNLSSLEILYCSILRVKAPEDKTVATA